MRALTNSRQSVDCAAPSAVADSGELGPKRGGLRLGGAAGTVSWTDPKEELAVAIMVQQPTRDLPSRIAEAVGAAIDD